MKPIKMTPAQAIAHLKDRGMFPKMMCVAVSAALAELKRGG